MKLSILLILGLTLGLLQPLPPEHAATSPDSLLMQGMALIGDRTLTADEMLRRLFRIRDSQAPSDLARIRRRKDSAIDYFWLLDLLSSYSLIHKIRNTDDLIDEMTSMYAHLHASTWASSDISYAMYRTHVANWNFAAADKIAKDTGLSLEHPLPQISPGPAPAGPAYYLLREGTLELTEANLTEGISIIITTGCGVTDGALAQVDQDARLGNALWRGNTLWLVPISKDIDFTALSHQSASYPRQRIVVSSNNAAWEEVEFSITPSIVFYKDGRVTHKLSGWPQDGSSYQELLDALVQLGLY